MKLEALFKKLKSLFASKAVAATDAKAKPAVRAAADRQPSKRGRESAKLARKAAKVSRKLAR